MATHDGDVARATSGAISDASGSSHGPSGKGSFFQSLDGTGGGLADQAARDTLDGGGSFFQGIGGMGGMVPGMVGGMAGSMAGGAIGNEIGGSTGSMVGSMVGMIGGQMAGEAIGRYFFGGSPDSGASTKKPPATPGSGGGTQSANSGETEVKMPVTASGSGGDTHSASSDETAADRPAGSGGGTQSASSGETEVKMPVTASGSGGDTHSASSDETAADRPAGSGGGTQSANSGETEVKIPVTASGSGGDTHSASSDETAADRPAGSGGKAVDQLSPGTVNIVDQHGNSIGTIQIESPRASDTVGLGAGGQPDGNMMTYDYQGISNAENGMRKSVSRSESILGEIRSAQSSLADMSQGQSSAAAQNRLAYLMLANEKTISATSKALDYLDLASTQMRHTEHQQAVQFGI
ncbi:hypothetical protein [Mycobacterium sp.]|uniref:hypothetical protein n=1 Tax=Mycobacterium sp. TaxID=1785 RepID=UPI003BAB825A